MTVETSQLDFAYAGDGATTTFATPYFALDTDLAATLRPPVGTPAQLGLGTDYTLSGSRNPQGGLLTIINPAVIPGPSTGTLLIFSNVPVNQLRAFPRGGPMDNKEYEASLDKLTILIQQLNADSERSIHAPPEDLAGELLLPLDYLRVNTILGFGADAKPVTFTYDQLADIIGPLILGTVTQKTLPKSREELGLLGDGGHDDSVTLVKAMRADSANGGATYYLQPQPGKTFLLAHGISIPSNINLVWAGLGVTLGADAGVWIRGDVAVDDRDHPYRLTQPAGPTDTRLYIDTGPRGGGAVSTHFPVGARVRINGNRDLADNPKTAERSVTASDTTSITLDSATGLTLLVDYGDAAYEATWGKALLTEVFKVISVKLTADGVIGNSFVQIDAAGAPQLQTGDRVLIDDDKTAANLVTGAVAQRVHAELFEIVGVNLDGSNTIRLNRRLEHAFDTAFRARVVRLDTCEGSSVSGCSVAFTAPPADASVPVFEIARAVGCTMANCRVSNEDIYGCLGPMFQFRQARDCTFAEVYGRNPKFLTGGTGYGAIALESAGCVFDRPDISGCRYNLIFRASTDCHATDAKLGDDAYVSIAFSGLGEVGCTVSLNSLTGGSKQATDVTRKRAVMFGGVTSMVGPSRCLVEDGRIAQYGGVTSAAVEFVAGAEECRVSCGMDDVQTAVWAEDSAVNGSILSKRCEVTSTVNGYLGRLVDVNGSRNGSIARTVQDLRLVLHAYGGSKQIVAQQVDGLRIEVDIDQVAIDATEPYAITATGCLRLQVYRCDLVGLRAGISIQSCPSAYMVFNSLTDFSGGTIMLQDRGGNTNFVWSHNAILGFAGTVDVPGTPSSGGRVDADAPPASFPAGTFPVLIT